MKAKRNLTILLIAIVALAGFIQTSSAKTTTNVKLGVINGKVLDAETKQPIEYANVRLFSFADSSLITGTITSVDGVFSLNKIPVGEYYIEISFIGFEKMTKPLAITRDKLEFSLNDIILSAQSHSIEDVNVVGEKTHIKYERIITNNDTNI